MIKLIIFDLDGTLVDTRLDISNSVNHALQKFNLDPKTVEEVTKAVGYGVDNLIRKCLENSKGERPSIREVIRIFRHHYANHCTDKTELYPGVMSFLQKNHQLSMSVLSNKPEEYCRLILEALNIENYFKLVVGGDTTPHKKPHPSGIELILNKLKVNSNESIVVGDSEPDIFISKAVGTKSIGILNGMGNTKKLRASNPDYLIENFKKLDKLLTAIKADPSIE